MPEANGRKVDEKQRQKNNNKHQKIIANKCNGKYQTNWKRFIYLTDAIKDIKI